MDSDIKIYDVHDPQQYEDDKEYWQNKTPEEKLHALEIIRHAGDKLGKKQNGDDKDFEEFIKLLNENKVRYLIVGGYAYAIHAP